MPMNSLSILSCLWRHPGWPWHVRKAFSWCTTMEQHVFAFSLIIEGATEKVLQLIMPLQSIYNQNLGFVEQKMYF
jgi:hypothetical protein